MRLADLQGQWQPTQIGVTIPASTTGILIPADPNRFAFGVCVPRGSQMDLTLTANNNQSFGIIMDNGAFKWFDFHKHGSLVNQAWSMSNGDIIDRLVTVFLVVQNPDQVPE